MTLKLIEVWFDGGSSDNGKASSRAYGSYEVDGGRELKHRGLRQQFGVGLSCNQAEYLALLAALKWLSHHVNPAEVNLRIKGDSQLVVNQVRQRWKCRVAHLRELRDEVREYLNGYRSWEINWHRRNNSVERFGH